MVTKKYVKDFVLTESLNSHGRLKTKAVYVGQNYYFCADAETMKRTKRQAAVCMSFGWLLWILALVIESYAARTIYIVMPFAVAALPMFFMAEHVWTLFNCSEPLTRQQSDKISERIPADSICITVLTGGAAAARLISFIAGAAESSWGDAAFCVCAVGVCMCTASIFMRRKSLKTRICEQDSPVLNAQK